MKTVLLVLCLLIAVVAVLAFLKRRGAADSSTDPWPFYAKTPLSKPEQVLYHRLVKALPEHIVLAQVQVSRVLGVRKGFNFNEWNNRINRLSYDFLVCSKDTAVIAAIELDDRTHERISRAETDAKKERATQAAGLRLIRWHVKTLPDEATIQAAFASRQIDVGPDPSPAGKRYSSP